MERKILERFFEKYGRSLTEADLPAVARCSEVPALVMGDDGVMAVSESEQVEEAFAGAAESYRERGLTEARPELLSVEDLGERTCLAHVRWSYVDEEEKEGDHSEYRYAMRLDDAGKPRIRAVLAVGAS